MSLPEQQRHYQLITSLRIKRSTLLLLFMLALAVLQAGCALSHGARRLPGIFRCEAMLRDARTREPVRVTSDDPSLNPLPAGPVPRLFVNNDWNGDRFFNINDVLTDWHRYIVNNILPSARFSGRSWCVEPGEMSCRRIASLRIADADAIRPLRAGTVATCPAEPSDARLEVSAPGLTPAPDYSLGFPNTPIGLTSSPLTITLRNAGTLPLRVNSTDFLGAFDGMDFIEPAGSNGCLPTEYEMGRGLGHELLGGASCNFQVQFRPLYRPGVGECDRDDTTSMSCNRVAGVRITSTTLGGRMLPPLTINLNGRAIGGRLVIEPASREICFTPPAAPLTDLMCTEERTITIRNEGARDTTGNITITSSGAVPVESFNAAPPSLAGVTLTPGDSRTVRVRYCERRDRADASYRIYSSSPREPTVGITIFNPNNRTCP
jgi:hypothetical protein